MNINDLINKNYKYVVGSSEESKIGENDREYVLSKIEDIIYHNLFDEDFFRNGLTPEQRTKYKSFFENEILSVMMKNVNKTLEQFFTVTPKNEVKWNLPLEKTKAMVKSSFNHKNIPSDVKQSYTTYNKINEMKITKSQLKKIIKEEINRITESKTFEGKAHHIMAFDNGALRGSIRVNGWAAWIVDESGIFTLKDAGKVRARIQFPKNGNLLLLAQRMHELSDKETTRGAELSEEDILDGLRDYYKAITNLSENKK